MIDCTKVEHTTACQAVAQLFLEAYILALEFNAWCDIAFDKWISNSDYNFWAFSD